MSLGGGGGGGGGDQRFGGGGGDQRFGGGDIPGLPPPCMKHCNVRSKCECTHVMRVCMVFVVRPRTYTIYIYIYIHLYIYSDKHISMCEANFFSLPNLSEGGSLH